MQAEPAQKHRLVSDLAEDIERDYGSRYVLLFYTFKSVIEAMQDPKIDLSHANITASDLNWGSQVIGINNSVRNISNNGTEDKALGNSLLALAEAIAVSRTLSPDDKQGALERIQFMAEQAEKPVEKRNKTMILAALSSLPPVIKGVAALVELWNKYEPAIAAYFGL